MTYNYGKNDETNKGMRRMMQDSKSRTRSPDEDQCNGHSATIGPWLLMQAKQPSPQRTSPFAITIDDATYGEIHMYGKLDDVPGAKTLVLAVHGLGGCAESLYSKALSMDAQRRHMACLRLSCRGSARQGEDLHHAGLYEDLIAALDSPRLARFEHIIIVGFSLGGHMSLRLSGARRVDRVDAVVAICPPVDLDEVTTHLDVQHRWIYRQHVLRGLHELYGQVAQRERHPTPLERVKKIRSIREWDALTTVPRFGFLDTDDYYRSQSVFHVVEKFHHPTFIVSSPNDPMIPNQALQAFAQRGIENMHLQWAFGGGHAFFKKGLTIAGGRAHDTVMGQTLDWVRNTIGV